VTSNFDFSDRPPYNKATTRKKGLVMDDINEKKIGLFDLLSSLERAKIFFTLHRFREDTIMIACTLVGSRIEIDFFEDGHIEYSIFKGNEDVEEDLEYLTNIIEQTRIENN
jgi:hypothetical protein